MYNEYKVIVCVPSGRIDFLKILKDYLLDELDIIDEIHLWFNTSNVEDVKYINYLKDNYSVIKIIEKNNNYGINNVAPQMNVKNFYSYCIDEDKIYFKVDDDIVYIEKGTFFRLCEFIINNKKFKFVFPLIINNGFCSFVMAKLGKIPFGDNLRYHIGAGLNYEFGVKIHSYFCDRFYDSNFIESLKFERWNLYGERFSINFMGWTGSNMKDLLKDGSVWDEDEAWVASKVPNCICGNSVVSHFSFCFQKIPKSILQKYKKKIKLL